MILNSKQLEELESIHDSVVEFEEEAASTENENFDEGADSTLAWRRGMIEKAAANVKKAHKKAVDPQSSYSLGTLLFDRAAKRFGRVESSKHGTLQVTYLSGGVTSIKHNQSNIAFEETAEVRASTPAQKSKPKAAAPEKKTAPAKAKLKQALPKKEETEVRDMPAVKSLIAKEKPAAKKKFIAVQKPAEKPTLKTVTKTKAPQKAVKSLVKKVAIAKLENKKAPVKIHKSPVKPVKKTGKQKATSYLPRSAISDPVADPNGYIKQYFRLMSNKELASVTGLSEHTIRRKLGEWGLKRLGKAK